MAQGSLPRPWSVVNEASGGVPFGEAVRAWVKVAAHSFGGPAGQIAVIHRVVVDEKRWVSEERFLHALSYCMLLPGPEAQQLATYTGWLLHGTRGGLVAGLLFILPGFVAILALSIVYALYRELTLVEAVFFGLKPAVLAIVIEALVRLKGRALLGWPSTAIAVAAFVGIFAFGIPFPLIVIGAAVLGIALRNVDRGPAVPNDVEPDAPRPKLRYVARTMAVWLAIWLLPVAALLIALDASHVFVREALFFGRAAVVTFGGAYAVLAYVAQQAVEVYGWLAPGEMLDGLGLAETTPGPLIMVVQFVGFLGAFRNPGALDPVLAGVIGSIVTTWVTFAPCFLFIFAGAPYIEYLRGRPMLGAALRGIMAAVVGVVLNLAVWFAIHTLFSDVTDARWGVLRVPLPDPQTIVWPAVLLAVAAMVGVFRFRLGLFTVLGGAAVAGIALRLLLP